MRNRLLNCIIRMFTLHTKKDLFFKSICPHCHFFQVMKSVPFVLHQLRYDVSVSPMLVDDNRMTLLDLIVAFRQSCINNSDPLKPSCFVLSSLLEHLWCFESKALRRCLSLLYLCVCFAFITWMFLPSLSLSVVPRILPHTQPGSKRLWVLLQNQGAKEEMAGAVRHGIVSMCVCVTVWPLKVCTVLFFRFVICLDNRHKGMI